MSLHPEVLKIIEAGPQEVPIVAYRGGTGFPAKRETPEEFALRIALRAVELDREEARKDAEAMKAATYSHVDGRDLLHELQPNGAHYIDILVRINGQDRRYEGDWLKNLTWARDGHNMGEYADNPQLRAMIEQRRKEGPHEVGECSSSIDAAIAKEKP